MAGVLEIEDAEQRLDRLRNTLQKLNDTTHHKSKSSSTPNPGLSFLNVENTRSKRQFIPPPSDLLSRVQAFLPALEASNALLSSQDRSQIDVEHIDSDSGPYIEMNLGLGLFDVRGSTSVISVPDIPMFPLSKSPSTSSDCSSSTATSSSPLDDWDSDEDSDVEIITSFKPMRMIKPLPRRAMQQMQAQVRPNIVVFGDKKLDCGIHNAEEG
ncbi:hypothetical protein C0995_003883 [Termitomyces sp. Mi166|nr:hypothetical protein C0995_003883 [Termitomyces sp. Mi166\